MKMMLKMSAVMAIVLLLGACSSSKPAPGTVPANLVGSQWRVERIGDNPVPETPPVLIRFEADRRVSGSTGVNSFTGPATFEMGRLKIGALAVTRKAGPPQLMQQESSFLKALNASSSYVAADSGRLHFTDAAGAVTLRVAPASDQ